MEQDFQSHLSGVAPVRNVTIPAVEPSARHARDDPRPAPDLAGNPL